MWRAVMLFAAIALISQSGSCPAEPLPVSSQQFIIEPDPALYPHVHASGVV